MSRWAVWADVHHDRTGPLENPGLCWGEPLEAPPGRFQHFVDGLATGAGRGGWRDEDAHQFTPASCDRVNDSSDRRGSYSCISLSDEA